MSKFYRTADRTVLLELFGPGESVENLKSLKANTTDAASEYCNLHGLWKDKQEFAGVSKQTNPQRKYTLYL